MEEDLTFQALSHRTRRKILRILAEEGPQTYSSLIRKTGLITGTLNHHLERMKGLIQVKDGLYSLTDEGWRAYEAMLVVLGEAELSSCLSPFTLIYRPDTGFRELARGKAEFVALALILGAAATAVTVYLYTLTELMGNVLIPLTVTALAAKLGYDRGGRRFLFTSPAALTPLLSQILIYYFRWTYAFLPKVGLIWYVYLLLLASKHGFDLDVNRSFVISLVGVLAGRIFLDSFGGLSLVLG